MRARIIPGVILNLTSCKSRLFSSHLSCATVTIRPVYNVNVINTLPNHQGNTLSEIHRDNCNRHKYITDSNYMSLPEPDRETLDSILFTYTGYYALHQRYISVDKFLAIPIEGRKHLSSFFYNAEEICTEAQMAKNIINRMFVKKHFDIDEYASLSDVDQKVLVNLLDVNNGIGMTAIENSCFSVHEFIGFNKSDQTAILTRLKKVPRHANDYEDLYRDLKDLMREIKCHKIPF